jgi:hypothetical protein
LEFFALAQVAQIDPIGSGFGRRKLEAQRYRLHGIDDCLIRFGGCHGVMVQLMNVPNVMTQVQGLLVRC